MRGEKTPSLVTMHERIPGTGPEGIDMYTGAGTCRSHDKPSIWRAALLTNVLEQIVSKIDRNLVVFQKLTPAVMLWKKAKLYTP